MIVKPNETRKIKEVLFQTVPAYNQAKAFHPKENGWVGYILQLEGEKIYIAGDTDNLPEFKKISCDLALVPIGGTYTMTVEEAAELIEQIKPRKVIPTHYGLIVGTKEDGRKFQKLVTKTEVELQI